MLLDRLGAVAAGVSPLRPAEVPEPVPGPGEILIDVSTCGVCHTELDIVEGRTPPRSLPLVLGHQIVGRVRASGPRAARFAPGERVGVAWIHSACGSCDSCRAGEENLCPDFVATGRDVDGGYAQRTKVDEAFAVPIPEVLADVSAAPLLCAGAVGWRALRLARLETGQRLGLTGFGASGHLVLAMARAAHPASEVFVFARDAAVRRFALERGAAWAGDTDEAPPRPLHAIIDTTPAWEPVVAALAALAPGGRLVINAIAKRDDDSGCLQGLDYRRHLWLEKEVKSVANVTREDVRACLALAAEAGIEPRVETFPLDEAGRALLQLASGGVRGALVLVT